MKTESFVDQIYLGTVLLEKNRWPDTPRTTFSRAEKLSRGRGAIPTVKPSEWAERARADGFDGLEISENQTKQQRLAHLFHHPKSCDVFSV